MKMLANEFLTIAQSPDPQNVFCYSPGICRPDNGRLIVTMDFGGPGVKNLPGLKSKRGDYPEGNQGKVFASDDGGASWKHLTDFPFYHARPFTAGKTLYVLGHAGDLSVMKSEDNGETWSAVFKLTENQSWHQAPCNVWKEYGKVYLVMEREVYNDCKAWTPSILAPVLMRGGENADLCKKENWTFASEIVFRDLVDQNKLSPFPIPFYPSEEKSFSFPAPGRENSPTGWLETNVVRISDPTHYWHDPSGKSFHLIMRTHTGGTGFAAIMKVIEDGAQPGSGAMKTVCEKLPSGKDIVFLPLPGGHMKFHIIYDEETKLYWLLSSQPTDSMTKAELLPSDRYNLPNNQRSRLVLHFSKNLVDWCFAGIVAKGETEKESRHYASMVIDGNDLAIVSRSGNKDARSAHNGNMLTFHKVKNFRELIY